MPPAIKVLHRESDFSRFSLTGVDAALARKRGPAARVEGNRGRDTSDELAERELAGTRCVAAGVAAAKALPR